MKRSIALILCAILILTLFSGCAGKKSEAELYYEGDWYGWWMITNSTLPDYEDDGQTSYWYDCIANFSFLMAGGGTLTIFDEDSSRDEPIAAIPILLNNETKVITSRKDGWFYESEVGEGDLTIDPEDAYYENNLVFELHFENDEGSFDGFFFLCPWGDDWQRIVDDNPDSLPYGFETWYLPKIEAGESAPDTIELDYDAIDAIHQENN